jgi:hypothetical protein
VGGHRHVPAALLLGKKPGTRCTEGWVGLGARVGGCGARTADRPVRRLLYMPTWVAVKVRAALLKAYWKPRFFYSTHGKCGHAPARTWVRGVPNCAAVCWHTWHQRTCLNARYTRLHQHTVGRRALNPTKAHKIPTLHVCSCRHCVLLAWRRARVHSAVPTVSALGWRTNCTGVCPKISLYRGLILSDKCPLSLPTAMYGRMDEWATLMC